MALAFTRIYRLPRMKPTSIKILAALFGILSAAAETRYVSITSGGNPLLPLNPSDVVEIVGATGGNQTGPLAEFTTSSGGTITVPFYELSQDEPLKPPTYIFTGMTGIRVGRFGGLTLKITTENLGFVTLTPDSPSVSVNPTDIVEFVGASGGVQVGPNANLNYLNDPQEYQVSFRSITENSPLKPRQFIFTNLTRVFLTGSGAFTLKITPQGEPVTPTEKVSLFEDRITATEVATATNTTAIAGNETSIQTNANGIAVNGANIQDNANGIAVNGANIQDNANGIAVNGVNIQDNANGIAVNGVNIQTNANDIAVNGLNIQTNRDDIAGNETSIQTNASGIATNVTAIAGNETSIQNNASGISTNVTAIAGNGTSIQTNTETLREINLALQANELERGRLALEISMIEFSLQNLQAQLASLGDNADFLEELAEEFATREEITTAINEGKAQGINAVTNDPNNWNVFTTDQIQEMAVGDLVLTREENGEFILNYEIQQSDNLIDWTTYSANAETITGLPANKAFVRIRTNQ
jgi:hypothetical protein